MQKTKRFGAILLALVMLTAFVPVLPVATAATDGDWEYGVYDGKATITKYNGGGGDVVIPNKLGGNPVTNIGNHVFYGCTGLTSVTLPDSVTTIGGWAFEECTGLTSVTIGNSVTYIGTSAFEKCTGLTSVTIGNSVTYIDWNAFYGCTGLMNITLPDSVTTIDGYAFSYCTGLTSVTIPDSVTSIGGGAFAYWDGDWKNLPNLTISCNSGSYAHTYATENNIPVKLLSTTYTVKFNKNGGSGTMKNQTIATGKSTKLTANSFTRKNYVFNGWNTKKNGSGTKYADKKSVKNIAKAGKTITFYAQWKKVAAPTKAVTNLKLTAPATKQLKVTYKAVSGADGYRIQYSTGKSFSKATTKTVHTTKLTYTIKSLSAKKTYYVRVTAFKVDSTKAKIYSKKMATKSLKTK